MPSASSLDVRSLASAALAVAVLAALESLLSAKVADGMAVGRRHDPDRELFGQGLANIAAPLFGGVPATGAIARTAVNVRAGASTRVASIVHALLLVAVVFLGSGLVARIPLAALAGVLMVTAARMVEVHNVRAVLRSTRSDAAVLVVTAVATVAFDLILAVEVGIAAAALLALRNVANTLSATAESVAAEVEAGVDDAEAAEAAGLLHDGIVSYRDRRRPVLRGRPAVPHRAHDGHRHPGGDLRLPDLQVLDATGARALGEIVAELEHRGVTVLLKGPRPEHLRVLEAVGALDRLAHENHLFATLPEAIAHARTHVARRKVAAVP